MGGRNIYSQLNIVKIHKGKAGSEMALPLLYISQPVIVDFWFDKICRSAFPIETAT